MKIKLLSLGVITSLLISCSSGPSACECLDVYEYNNVSFSDFQSGKKQLPDPRPCVEKYGKEIPAKYIGKEIYRDKMKEILREKCNR